MTENNEMVAPLISIIVPIYQSEKFLYRCLDSIQKQTYSNLEIILIDDGSFDNSPQICKEFCQDDARFKYIRQTNQGVSAARNNGIDVATGEYIGFCDSDDWIDLDMYECLLDLIQKHESEIAIISLFEGVDNENEKYVDDETVFEYNTIDALKEVMLGKKFAGHLCNKLFKKQLFRNVRLPIGVAVAEDLVVMWDLISQSDKVVFQNVHKYHYAFNTVSATHAFKETSWSIQVAGDIIYKKTCERMPEIINYAKGVKIRQNFWLINVLYDSKQLTKENYKKVKSDMRKYVDKQSLSLLAKREQLIAKTFLGSRVIYIFMRSRWLTSIKKLVSKIMR